MGCGVLLVMCCVVYSTPLFTRVKKGGTGQVLIRSKKKEGGRISEVRRQLTPDTYLPTQSLPTPRAGIQTRHPGTRA